MINKTICLWEDEDGSGEAHAHIDCWAITLIEIRHDPDVSNEVIVRLRSDAGDTRLALSVRDAGQLGEGLVDVFAQIKAEVRS